MHRKLKITTNISNLNKFQSLNKILNKTDIMKKISDRNIFIDIKNSENDSIKMYGYDETLKYSTNNISYEEFIKIFDLIDKMPIRQEEMLINGQKGGDMNLYTDNNPETTLKGTGYKDKKKALETLKLISHRSIIYQKSVVTTMYYRAKNHPNKTQDMMDAMNIFGKWLKDNKKTTIKYGYLDLKIVKIYEKLAEYYDISHVARGLKKASKTDKGFLVIYKKYKGNKNKLPFIPVLNNKPSGMDFDIYREKFINARLGQMKYAKVKLYTPEGLPTKQHTILIMHAYSPDPKGIIDKIKVLENYLKKK